MSSNGSKHIVIYSDGGADPNPGIGGWAAILIFDEHERILSGSAPSTTNNRMELTAAIEALGALKTPCKVELYTDSEYLRRGITQWLSGWKARGWLRSDKRPVPNKDLWQRLEQLTANHTIDWHWVKGHAGNEYNERVDQLAREARLAVTPAVEIAADIPRLYVRASCRGNPGPGGWGATLETLDDSYQNSGSAADTTSNRMELMAVIEGLALAPIGSQVQLFTMSDYVFQGATRWIHGWRGRGWQKRNGDPIANSDLWQRIDALMSRYDITWINAKGQSSSALNTAAKLAANAARLES